MSYGTGSEDITVGEKSVVIRGTSADNNTINLNPTHIHIHIHSDNPTIIDKVMRSINGIFGQRSKTIAKAEQLSISNIQRGVVRAIENGRCDNASD